jgi:hypothetical protein
VSYDEMGWSIAFRHVNKVIVAAQWRRDNLFRVKIGKLRFWLHSSFVRQGSQLAASSVTVVFRTQTIVSADSQLATVASIAS